MNIPNLLTLLRASLAFVIVYLLVINPVDYAYVLSFILFLLASFLDYLDGIIARKQALISNFGKIMDPIADKLLVLSTLFAFSYLDIVSLWMVILIALREVFITSIRIHHLIKGKVLAAKQAGKYKTIFQMLVISFIFIIIIVFEYREQSLPDALNIFLNLLVFALVVITFYSGIVYLKRLREDL